MAVVTFLSDYLLADDFVGEGEPVLYQDAYRTLAPAVNRGSAAAAPGVGLDAEMRIRRQS